jgi:hypothetical protein
MWDDEPAFLDCAKIRMQQLFSFSPARSTSHHQGKFKGM